MALINQNPAFSQAGKAIREFPVVESSFLENVHYDPNTLQCVVTMKSGSQYVYNMVFPMVIDQWMQSPSKGQFFAKNIRGKFSMHYRMVNKSVGPKGQPRGGQHGNPRTEGTRHTRRRGR